MSRKRRFIADRNPDMVGVVVPYTTNGDPGDPYEIGYKEYDVVGWFDDPELEFGVHHALVERAYVDPVSHLDFGGFQAMTVYDIREFEEDPEFGAFVTFAVCRIEYRSAAAEHCTRFAKQHIDRMRKRTAAA